MSHPVDRVIAAMREEAERLERLHGLVDGAVLLRDWIPKIEAALREYEIETLTVTEAAQEEQVSYSTVWRRVKRGTITNVGTEGHPLVRRCDLHGKRTVSA